MAYSLLILDRLVLCQCYRDNSFPGGVHVFLQRPSEIIKRLKCGRGIRSEIRVGSQRILERTGLDLLYVIWFSGAAVTLKLYRGRKLYRPTSSFVYILTT